MDTSVDLQSDLPSSVIVATALTIVLHTVALSLTVLSFFQDSQTAATNVPVGFLVGYIGWAP